MSDNHPTLDDSELSPAQRELKKTVLEAAGYWHPFHEGLLQHDPELLSSYLAMSHGSLTGVITPEMKELIFLAIDAVTNHLFEPGIGLHVWLSLKMKTPVPQLTETLQIACSVVWTSQALTMSKLAKHVELKPATQNQRDMEALYRERVGRWPEWADSLYTVKPEFAERFFHFCALPWLNGKLPAKDKALLYLAVNATPTVARDDEVEFYTERALFFGATPEEIVETTQLAAAVAIHTCAVAVPKLTRALKKLSDAD